MTLFWEGLWQDGEQNCEKYREALCLIKIGFGVFWGFLLDSERKSSEESCGTSHQGGMLSTTGDLNLGFFPGGLKKERSPGDVQTCCKCNKRGE